MEREFKPQLDLESHLKLKLEELELAYRKILQSQPYNQESEKIRILQEIIKEQIKNENTGIAAR